MTGTLPVTIAGAGPGEGGGEVGSLVESGFEHAERISAATIATTRRSGVCMTVRATSIPSILIIVFEGRAMARHLGTPDQFPWDLAGRTGRIVRQTRSAGSAAGRPGGLSVSSPAATSKSCLFETTAGRGGAGSAVCSQACNSGMCPSGPVYNADSHRN